MDELGKGEFAKTQASGACCGGPAGVDDGDGGSRYVNWTSGEELDEAVIWSSALYTNCFESSA